jgi:hypothetical protein
MTEQGDSPAAAELKKYKYSIDNVGSQVDAFTKTTKAISEYSARTFGQSMKLLILGDKTVPEKPQYPKEVNEMNKAIWSKEYDQYLKRQDKYDENKAKVFAIVLAQCDKPMRNTVESATEFKGVEAAVDVVGLIRIIKDIAFDANDKKYASMQATMAWCNLVKATQREDEDLIDYYKRFISLIEMVERSYGQIAPEEIAKKSNKYTKNPGAVLSIERSRMLAYMFMNGANKRLFGYMLRSLENNFALGTDLYPATMEDALQVLTLSCENITRKKSKGGADNGDPAMAFVQGTNVKCWKCGKEGHIKINCPEAATQNSHVQVGTQEETMSWTS